MTIKPLQLAGRIIMENGGETYRVEETVTRMGRAFGLKNVESFAVPSGVLVSCEKEDGTHETAVLRVHRRGTNLRRVDAVNQISRRAEAGEITPEEALRALEKIEHSLSFRPWQLCVAAAVSSGGFAVMFGGGVADFFVGVATAGLVQALTCLLGRYRLEGMVSTLVGSFFTTLLPLLLYHFTHVGTVDACVAGALMPLLPGLAMTNAVQDTMRGDIVSGVAHGMNAILTASCIGAVGYTLYWALMVWAGLPETAAIFIGSVAASVLAQYAARRLKMIATVFGTLAIIAFVPGLGLYRCMSLLAQGNTSLGLQTGIVAMSNIVMITFGLGVGSFLMRMIFAARAERKHHGG